MTFDEHLEQTKDSTGEYDAAAAQASREAELTAEMAGDPATHIARAAKNQAVTERTRWERANRDRLHAEFKGGQGALDVDLAAKVPLGGNVSVNLGEMHKMRIQIRKDLVTRSKLDHDEAFRREMHYWYGWEALLPDNATISEVKDQLT